MDSSGWGTTILLLINGVLMTLVGGATFFAGIYFKEMIRKSKVNEDKIGKVHSDTIDTRARITRVGETLCSSNKSIWDELIKVRRSVDNTNTIIQRRQLETDKILSEQRRAKNTLAKHTKALTTTIKVLKKQGGRLGLLQTKVITLNDEMMLIKNRDEK